MKEKYTYKDFANNCMEHLDEQFNAEEEKIQALKVLFNAFSIKLEQKKIKAQNALDRVQYEKNEFMKSEILFL